MIHFDSTYLRAFQCNLYSSVNHAIIRLKSHITSISRISGLFSDSDLLPNRQSSIKSLLHRHFRHFLAIFRHSVFVVKCLKMLILRRFAATALNQPMKKRCSDKKIRLQTDKLQINHRFMQHKFLYDRFVIGIAYLKSVSQ